MYQVPYKSHYSITDMMRITGIGRDKIKEMCRTIRVRGFKWPRIPHSERERIENLGGVSGENPQPNAQKDIEELQRRNESPKTQNL